MNREHALFSSVEAPAWVQTAVVLYLVIAHPGGVVADRLLFSIVGINMVAYGTYSVFRPGHYREALERQRRFGIRWLPFTKSWTSPETETRARVLGAIVALAGLGFLVIGIPTVR